MSDSYIFRFATIMVIIVAAVLTTVATLLKPLQEDNKRAEKMQAILSAANIHASRDESINIYKDRLLKEYAINLEGEIVSTYEGQSGELIRGAERPFEINMKELKNKLNRYEKGELDQPPPLPLFMIEGKQGDSLYVIPVRGKGLWGPIWGNIALKNDLNTIEGASFDHAGETPGLGAEINTRDFSEQFKDTEIFNENGDFVSVKVVKGKVENSSIPAEHGVDAISGGTITSNGVSEMIENGIRYYLPYIQKHK
ncbi:MAG: NADH:ubiquinone reductase (Na(+)-transporting) subunit C [Bacteroidales bacterium]